MISYHPVRTHLETLYFGVFLVIFWMKVFAQKFPPNMTPKPLFIGFLKKKSKKTGAKQERKGGEAKIVRSSE